MKGNTIILSVSIVALALSSLALWTSFTKAKKIGYVRSKEIFDGYLGTKEAVGSYKAKAEKWQANLDTLGKEYENAIQEYQAKASQLSHKERGEREALLERKEQSLENYRRAIQEKAAEEDKQTTQGVINQVNSFVQEYAKENGYDIIFGTTASGNILYGNEAIDITEPVLKKLNASYQGK